MRHFPLGCLRVSCSLVVLVVGGASARAALPLEVTGSPAKLLIDWKGTPALGEPLTLNLIVVSQVSAAAKYRVRLSLPPELGSTASDGLSGSLAASEQRNLSVTVVPRGLGDLRLAARLEFVADGARFPFVVDNAAVLRVRATRAFGDVFVEQKPWTKAHLHHQIQQAKATLAQASVGQRDERLATLQGRAFEPVAQPEFDAALVARQAAYATASRRADNADLVALKQRWLGPSVAGQLGSRERYSKVDGLVRRAVPVSFVYRKELFFEAGERYALETRQLTPGSDTVAYLFAREPTTAEWTEVASNDDASPSTLGSRIDFLAERNGSYLLVVRSYSYQTRGACDIYVNDELLERTRFAGVAFGITADEGDVLQTVGLKRTPNRTDPILFVRTPADGTVRWDDDGGMENGAKLVLPSLRGAELVLGAYASSLEGTADLVLNTADGSVGPQARGDLDGDGLSNELEREIGTRPDVADSDGDGLLDGWEVLGVRDTDYAGLGAGPMVPDVFVQIDWMASTHDHHPRAAALQTVIDSFASTGINLHIDDGNPAEGGLGHLLPDPWTHLQFLGLGSSTYNQIKAENFDSSTRGGIYHYNIHAHQQSSGCSSGVAFIRGFDLLVTLGCFSGQIGTVNDQAGTFMHELGHNLGLRHGGFQDLNYKPNYRSVMNYLFQVSGTCGTLRYTTGVTFSACFPTREFFYSFGVGIDLDENCLDETVGIGEGPLDWNRDGLFDTCVDADINHPAGSAPDGRYDLLRDYDDYRNLYIAPTGFGSEPPLEPEIVTCSPPLP